MAVDLKLGPDNDFVFDSNGRVQLISGAEEVAQHIDTELQTPVGTHSIDTEFGMPFVDVIFVKNPNIGAIGAIIRGTIQSREDIEQVTRFDLTFDRTFDRELQVDWEAQTTEGLASGSVEI